jgi:hypothetical protein
MRRARLFAAALLAALAASTARADAPYAATLYGGVVTKETWDDLILAPWDARLEDGGLVVAGLSARLATPAEGRLGALEWEAEALLSRHWGAQDHWALALVPATLRWRAPGAPISAAFGLGLSAASEVPEAERATQGGSSAVMTYWALELEAGLPDTPWSAALRLHHRSTAYGLFGDAGGANAVILGLRRRFRRAPCTAAAHRGERGRNRRSPAWSMRCPTCSRASGSSPRPVSRSSSRVCRGRRRT